jgi:mRNA interferase RelE/StbE
VNGAATQVCAREFDSDFLKLPPQIRARIESKIDDIGRRLGTFQHYRMTGSDRYRLRIGDYRVIYRFDIVRNEIHLLAIGHRRDVYR